MSANGATKDTLFRVIRERDAEIVRLRAALTLAVEHMERTNGGAPVEITDALYTKQSA